MRRLRCKARSGLFLAMLVPSFMVAVCFGSCRVPENLQELRGSARQQPNLVLIVIDDWGAKDAGYLGSDFYQTPYLDELASEGLVMTQGYSNGPNCAPSRACLMTGRWSPRHGIYTVGSPARGRAEDRGLIPAPNKKALGSEARTFAQLLKEAGYHTASFGKWHLGVDPTEHGFHLNVAGGTAGHPPGGYFSPYRNAAVEDGVDGEYLTDRLTQEALSFLEEHQAEVSEQPFFLYLPFYSVHTPIQVPAKWKEPFQTDDSVRAEGTHRHVGYAGMLAAVDHDIGRITDYLQATGLSEDTLVCIVSDNGGHGRITSMEPLRGSKGMLYEGGIRIPWIFHWPGEIAPSQCSMPVSLLDLAPTYVELAGAELPESVEPFDGRSLTELMGLSPRQDFDWSERELYWHFPAYLESYGKQDESPWRTTPVGSLRKGRFKLLEFFEDQRLELYDLLRDPGETEDLASSQPLKVQELHGAMKGWRERVQADMPTAK